MDGLSETSADTVPADTSFSNSLAPRGCIELICGCMFSGKTTRLLEVLRDEPAQAILIVKHDKDDRYGRSRVMTHNGDGCAAVSIHRADDILERVADATEVIAIDEGHFYDERLPEVCAQLADRGKRVVVTALDTDMWGRPFAIIEQLKAVAGVVCVQSAICAACGKPANRTYRKTPIRGKRLVGGNDDFEPRCPDCWSPPPEEPIDSADMA